MIGDKPEADFSKLIVDASEAPHLIWKFEKGIISNFESNNKFESDSIESVELESDSSSSESSISKSDFRSRLQSPLGNNFTGNTFVLTSISCLVKDLLEQPLHITIQKIQEAKDIITDEYIKLYTKALESFDKFFPSMRESTIVTDWLKFPLHALDFGWEKVSSVAFLITLVSDTAFLMPNLEDSDEGFLVRIGIEGQHVQSFIGFSNDFN
ncbi:brassinosteroid-related acyltransferase 1-like [Camellia sinensis]|uniref:brassinosteroid-related acyltransferase 1-like n=1 Tax=Camellia sinensis TaxID=4442 RepID=UPI0010364EE1|nr:brassinosteroid-related acyltransferase 1-like [Camellia sinensis]